MHTLLRKDKTGRKRSDGVLLYTESHLKYEIIGTSEDIEQLFVDITYNKSYLVRGIMFEAPDINNKFFIDYFRNIFNSTPHCYNAICLG